MSRFLEQIIDRLYRRRLLVLLTGHVALIAIANAAAFWLRFDGVVPPEQQPYDFEFLPLLVAVRLAVFLPLRLHLGVWRYASIWDLRNIVTGVALSSVAFWAIVHGLLGARLYPRSVFIIDAIILVFLMGGVRLGRRFYGLGSMNGSTRRVLIYGAGDAGEMIARDMLNNPTRRGIPVAFVDDDASKRGLKIHGLPVIGPADISGAIDRLAPAEILIAIPSAEPKVLRRIVDTLTPSALPLKTLPPLRDISDGAISVNEVRDLSVADLLSRAPVGLDPARLSRLIEGQSVLVTGAGGSIGSELCRQILRAGPAHLTMVDRYENGLFAIHSELQKQGGPSMLSPLIGDVTDEDRLDQVFAGSRPAIVFHAAAHKHVPLMEANACEAVKNNVRGTRLVAEAATRWKTGRFVLISTDKAVNPTSTMGATKLIAESVVRLIGDGTATSFTVVRFGNVLGSNGSVVPTFLEQIRKGGPVTVTHPDVRRYFMLIPEAVQLVMHAAAFEGQGNIFVLDMGDQIRVADMARDLIRLSGFVPDDDIEIVYVGLRPGEKLFEELVGPNESAERAEVDKIHRVHAATTVATMSDVLALERLALVGDDTAVRTMLRGLMPTLNGAAAGEPTSVPIRSSVAS